MMTIDIVGIRVEILVNVPNIKKDDSGIKKVSTSQELCLQTTWLTPYLPLRKLLSGQRWSLVIQSVSMDWLVPKFFNDCELISSWHDLTYFLQMYTNTCIVDIKLLFITYRKHICRKITSNHLLQLEIGENCNTQPFDHVGVNSACYVYQKIVFLMIPHTNIWWFCTWILKCLIIQHTYFGEWSCKFSIS